MSNKFCKDCKWVVSHQRRRNTELYCEGNHRRDRVTGFLHSAINCAYERSVMGNCGWSGQFWEAADAPQDTESGEPGTIPPNNVVSSEK